MFKTKVISINGLNDVYEFIRQASKVDGDVLLKRGKFVVDAKSFLGVLSIDVSQDTTLSYPEDANDFENYIKQFIKEQA